MALVAESRSEMRHMVKVLDKACERWGRCISVDKTKILAVREPDTEHPSIILQDRVIEEVESFTYLGSEIGQSAVVEKEVAVTVKTASTVYQMLRRTIFRNQNLSKSTKVCV